MAYIVMAVERTHQRRMPELLHLRVLAHRFLCVVRALHLNDLECHAAFDLMLSKVCGAERALAQDSDLPGITT